MVCTSSHIRTGEPFCHASIHGSYSINLSCSSESGRVVSCLARIIKVSEESLHQAVISVGCFQSTVHLNLIRFQRDMFMKGNPIFSLLIFLAFEVVSIIHEMSCVSSCNQALIRYTKWFLIGVIGLISFVKPFHINTGAATHKVTEHLPRAKVFQDAAVYWSLQCVVGSLLGPG